LTSLANTLALGQTGITEISLVETPMDEYQNENYFSGKASFTVTGGTTGDIVDVHFLNDNVNTWFQGAQSQVFGSTYAVNPETLFLPLSRGYGSLPSLHIAMTENDNLLSMMRDLVYLDVSEYDQLSSKIEAFLYEWAGVTGNDPDARQTGDGTNIDARKIDFIEKFTGVEWAQLEKSYTVGTQASLGAKKSWSEVTNLITERILVQGTYSEVFSNASYDFMTDSIVLGDNLQDIITKAQNFISGNATPEQEHNF